MEIARILHFLLLTISICAWQNSHAQISPTKIEDLDSLMAHHPKPLLVLLSTEWCQYCAMQKQQIQKNDKFNQQADQFYFLEFDAESKDKTHFLGRTYSFKPSGVHVGTHELAIALNGSEKISYPTWVLLDPEFTPLFRQNGLLNPDQLNKLLDVMHETFEKNEYNL